jgi:hypothetical protein
MIRKIKIIVKFLKKRKKINNKRIATLPIKE